MPNPLALTPALVTELKIGSTDKLKLAILLGKTAATPTQSLDIAAFAVTQATTDENVSKAIAALESAKALSATYGAMTLTWIGTQTTIHTNAEIQSQWASGLLDDPTYYTLQALLLTKGAGATQVVDPATYTAAPWNLTRTQFLSEVAKLAARKPTAAKPLNNAPFTVDYGPATLTWTSVNVP